MLLFKLLPEVLIAPLFQGQTVHVLLFDNVVYKTRHRPALSFCADMVRCDVLIGNYIVCRPIAESEKTVFFKELRHS